MKRRADARRCLDGSETTRGKSIAFEAPGLDTLGRLFPFGLGVPGALPNEAFMTLLADIDKLKNSVLHAHDLSKAWNQFFDLTMHPSFMQSSSPCGLKNLDVILHHICKRMAPASTGQPRTAPVMRCQDTDFYHGALQIDGKPGAFIYFDDARTGMAALITHGIKTEFCRFTATLVQSPHCFAPPPSDRPAMH